MKKLTLLIITIVCFASLGRAQSTRPPGPRAVTSLPSTPCRERDFIQLSGGSRKAYLCQNALWAEVSASSGGGGAADVTGPASSTDEAVVRFNGTTGKAVQNSPVTISDGGLISGATIVAPTSSTQPANKTYVDSAVATIAGNIPKLSGLASGGGVIWESAYTFRVSAATYYINGVLYSSAEQTITLTAAHATLDRIDVLALNTSGTLIKIDGTAAAQPSEPDYDPSTQLKLTFVFVGANTTEPAGVSNENVYLENTEWTTSTSGSGWNANSTNNPRTGTKDIEGTSVANGAYVQLQRGSSTALDSFGTLSLFIRSKATFNNNRVLRVQFFLSGVAKGNALTIADSFWGFDSSNTASYQLIAIPVSQFAIPSGTLVNQLRISDQGGALGVYIDDVVLQALGTTISPPAQTGITQAQGDARYAQRASNLSDLNSASTARTNLGLGSIATQAASNVTITGGSITGITDLAVADGGTGASTASGARANLGSTTVGDNLFTATNPSAISFPKVAADNSVSFRTPTQLTSDLDAMTGDSGSGGVKGLVPAPATGDAAANKFLNADGTWKTAGSTSFASGQFEQFRFFGVNKNPGSTTNLTAIGISAVTPFGDSSNADDDADGPFIRWNTAASTNAAAGHDWNSASLVRVDWKPQIFNKAKTHTSIAVCRIWIGAFSSDPATSNDPAVHGMGFRFSTSASDTAWQAWTNDGSGGGTITNTGVTVSTSTTYMFVIKVVSNSSVEFYISTDLGSSYTLVATHSTNLPTSSTGMNFWFEIVTLENVAKSLKGSYTYFRQH